MKLISFGNLTLSDFIQEWKHNIYRGPFEFAWGEKCNSMQFIVRSMCASPQIKYRNSLYIIESIIELRDSDLNGKSKIVLEKSNSDYKLWFWVFRHKSEK